MKTKWIIGEKHPEYGKVSAMEMISGESYRWFVKNNVVSMIPLSVLLEQTQGYKRIIEKGPE